MLTQFAAIDGIPEVIIATCAPGHVRLTDFPDETANVLGREGHRLRNISAGADKGGASSEYPGDMARTRKAKVMT